MRKKININKNWEFSKQNEQSPKEWINVSLPHTWNAVDGANGDAFQREAFWYKKTVTLPKEEQGKCVFIEFQGANSVTDVFLNGNHLGQHRGGYSIFRFDLSEYFKFGVDNVLEVKVDNSALEDIYPLRADFTFFGGIYRDVNLLVVDPLHIDLLDYGSQGVYIVQESVTEERAQLNIKTRVTNRYSETKKVRLWIDLFDQAGNYVTYRALEVQLEAGETKIVTVPMIITDPQLWGGGDEAHLYEARVSLQRHNDTLDQMVVPFGVRFFVVNPQKGLYLNGKNIRLNGVSRHQDRKDMGWAITHKEHNEDMALIKEIGANSIRLAHYQHDQYFYDLCDREGMVVWAEIPFITRMSYDDLTGENAKSQLIELIRQNYNHPSILFWGIQNEIQIDSNNETEVRQVVKELNQLAKEEDPTRLTTMANVCTVDKEDEYNYMTDVIGANQYFGWYFGKTEDFAGWIDEYHETNPNTSLCISEYGAEGIIEYHSDTPKIKDYTEEYHALYHEIAWNIFAKRPFLWATYVWNMFDFGANIRDEGGVKGRNNKGLVTYDRQVKKDAFYMYKAHWSKEPFVHIAGKRYVDRSQDQIQVKVYTNCEKATLFINEEEFATQDVINRKIVFNKVPLVAGTNRVQVVATKGNIEYRDHGWFEKVIEPNRSYEAPVKDSKEHVTNWFEQPEFDDEPLEAVEIPEGVYSTRDTLGELMNNEITKAIIIKNMGGDISQESMYGMIEGMKVDVVASMAGDDSMFNPRMLNRLNRELIKIQK